VYAKSDWTCSKKKVNVNVSARCTVGWIFEEFWPVVSLLGCGQQTGTVLVLSLFHVAKFTRLLSMTSCQHKTRRVAYYLVRYFLQRWFCYSIVIYSPCNFARYYSTRTCCRNSELDMWTTFCVNNDNLDWGKITWMYVIQFDRDYVTNDWRKRSIKTTDSNLYIV